jgi:hypothetical protein
MAVTGTVVGELPTSVRNKCWTHVRDLYGERECMRLGVLLHLASRSTRAQDAETM